MLKLYRTYQASSYGNLENGEKIFLPVTCEIL